MFLWILVMTIMADDLYCATKKDNNAILECMNALVPNPHVWRLYVCYCYIDVLFVLQSVRMMTLIVITAILMYCLCYSVYEWWPWLWLLLYWCIVCVTVCTNDDPDCDYWASIGQCSSNPLWMHKNCWKSCMKCYGDLREYMEYTLLCVAINCHRIIYKQQLVGTCVRYIKVIRGTFILTQYAKIAIVTKTWYVSKCN